MSQHYFGKELYMFRTDILSIIRNLNTVYTATGMSPTVYVDCLLARSGWNCAVNTASRLLMMDIGKMIYHLLKL